MIATSLSREAHGFSMDAQEVLNELVFGERPAMIEDKRP
jgi:hypothetical protein